MPESVTINGNAIILGGQVRVVTATEGAGGAQVPGGMEIEWVLGQPTVARVTGKTQAATNIEPGDFNSLYVDGSIQFVGSCAEVSQELLGMRTDANLITASYIGHEYILQRRLTGTLAGSTVQGIMDELAADILTPEGIAVGTVDSGGTTVFKVKFEQWRASDVMDRLAEIVGGYWYIDPWPPTIHLRQFGAVSAPWALSASADVRNLRVRHHRDEYFNQIVVDNGTSTETATDAAEVSARQAEEGGTGLYERLVSVDAGYSSGEMQSEADQVLARHDEFGYEITYTTESGNTLDVGMDQTVNLEDEFGITAGTAMRIQRKTLRELESGEYEYDITLQTVDYGGEWERQLKQAFMPGTFGTPRYYLP